MHKKRRAASSAVQAEGFRDLQRGLTGDRSLIGESYMDDPEKLRAYLDYYWPVSRAQARYALDVFSRLSGRIGGNASPESFPFRRLIDVGSGPGPIAAAFADSGAEELFLLDQSSRALSLASRELPKKCESFRATLSSLVCDISNPEPSRIPLWGKADCVSFGHSLNEVYSGEIDRTERRAALLERYSLALVPGGVILLIEPALLTTSRDLLAVRNLLVERGWRVLAPCVGRASLSCPALEAGETQTCHDELSWKIPESVAALARSLKLDKESLKMSWFILQPPLSRNGADNADGEGFYRVVSDAMLNKGGRVRRLLCGEDGRFPLSVLNGSQPCARSGFDKLARGDVIRVVDPEIRENGWGVTEMTKIVKRENDGRRK
jgi:hypothetical protein